MQLTNLLKEERLSHSEHIQQKTKNDPASVNTNQFESITVISDLPNEILVKIVNFLPTRDILVNVGLVSKHLNDVSKDSYVGINVKLTTEKTGQPEVIQNVLSLRNKQIKTLEVSLFSSQAMETMSSVIGQLSQLKKLFIRNLPSPSLKQLLENIFQLKNLKDLSLVGPLDELSLSTIGECRQLERLHFILRPSYVLSDLEFRQILSLKNLTSLNLRHCQLNFNLETASFPLNQSCTKMQLISDLAEPPVPLSYIKFITSHFPKLKRLEIKCREIKVDSFEDLSKFLRSLFARCKHLELVGFYCNSFDIKKFNSQFRGWTSFGSKDIRLYKV
jgi:hypothetical protein